MNALGAIRLVAVLGMVFSALVISNYVVVAGQTQSTLCAQSAIQLVPGATLCASAQVLTVSDMALASNWMGPPSSPTQITVLQGLVTVYYSLDSGASFSSATLGYCTNANTNTPSGGYACPSLTSLSITNQGVNTNGLGTFTAQSPTMSVNTPYYFVATVTESTGSTASSIQAVQYVQSTYPVTFYVTDAVSNVPLTGAQVIVYSGSQPVTTVYTSSGFATTNLAYGQYAAYAYAKNYIGGVSQTFFAQSSPTLSFQLTQNVVLTSSTTATTSCQPGYNLGPCTGTPTGTTCSVVGSTTNCTTSTTTTSTSGSAAASCTNLGSNSGVTVTVSDIASGKAVSGAVISIGGQTATTSSSGVATVANIPVPGAGIGQTTGTSTLVVSATSYKTFSQVVTLTEGSCASVSAALTSATAATSTSTTASATSTSSSSTTSTTTSTSSSCSGTKCPPNPNPPTGWNYANSAVGVVLFAIFAMMAAVSGKVAKPTGSYK